MHSEILQTTAAFPNVQGTCFWVAGAARSGIAAALLLKQRGARVFVSDSAPISQESKVLLTNAGIAFEESTHTIADFLQSADFLVLSPAIPLCKGLALVALQNGIPILSEIEVASWCLQPSQTVVGITGTNGKSTVTHYLAQLFERAGKKAVACGNIGLPFASALAGSTPPEVFSLELSSYQLETTHSLRPAATVLLNLQSDHLARYQSMEQYLRAKWRLALLTSDSGVCAVDYFMLTLAVKLGLPLPACKIIVLNFPWPQSSQARQKVLNHLGNGSQKLPISTYQQLSDISAARLLASTQFGSAWVEKSSSGSAKFKYVCDEKHFEHTFADPCLPGDHNLQNLGAASAAALFLGVRPNIVFGQWESATSSYVHLPHRLEFVGGRTVQVQDMQGRTKTISIVNDSKATNVESALVALKSFSQNVRLLLGGEPKGESFEPLARFFPTPVVRCYAFGAAASLVTKELEGSAPLQAFPGMLAAPSQQLLEAAAAALEDAVDGDVILLSPACASFDEFKNFEHRGDIFRGWALKLVGSSRHPLQEK